MQLQNELENGKGYTLAFKLTDSELSRLRKALREQWLMQIEMLAPQHFKKFKSIEMYDYHLFSHLLEHDQVWVKKSRVLSDNVVRTFRATPFFQALEDHWGAFLISNEEKISGEEIYW